LVTAVVAIIICAGCSSAAVQEKEITHMTRQEVINAVQECEGSGMRPVVVYALDTFKHVNVSVPVDVQCSVISHATGYYVPPTPFGVVVR